MAERLSAYVEAALRAMPRDEAPMTGDVRLAITDILREIGYFAREMERTDVLHDGEPTRQRIERERAALRFYGRLLEAPYADNVVSIPIRGIGRVLLLESTRS